METEITSTWVELPTSAGIMSGYMARPTAPGQYPAVLVCFEIFGVTGHIRDITERVARLGYVAVAPDFYHRQASRIALPHDTGREQGLAMMRALRRDEVVEDLRAAVTYLRARPDVTGRIGALGFSLGGHIACLAAACADVAVTASFYGGWLTTTEIGLGQPEPTVRLFPQIASHDGRIAFFFAGQDHVITREQRDAIEAALTNAGVRHEIVVYASAKHGFFCDQRDTFDPPSRDDAWRRVRALFDEELRR